jgi:hypothetical protein
LPVLVFPEPLKVFPQAGNTRKDGDDGPPGVGSGGTKMSGLIKKTTALLALSPVAAVSDDLSKVFSEKSPKISYNSHEVPFQSWEQIERRLKIA